MAEKEESKPGKGSGWLKTIVCTFVGLFSGAFVTYLTPLVDKLVKPAKPLANFMVESQGLAVTFHDRSTGGTEGWWDFGDGSPLEPVAPEHNSVSHTYGRPGNYTAKLSLRNFIGEESERSVLVALAESRPEDPVITAFDVVPVTPTSYAPATFRISAKVKNADWFVYDFGDSRPMKVVTDPANETDRMVTFTKAGSHTLKLLVACGKKTVEKNQVVWVSVAPQGMVSALLTVTDQGTRVEKRERADVVGITVPSNAPQSVFPIDRQVRASLGFAITNATWKTVTDNGSRNLKVAVAPDGSSARLTGELVRATGLLGQKATSLLTQKSASPSLVGNMVLVEERRSSDTRLPAQVGQALPVPGSVTLKLPPVQANWVNVQRSLQLELKDGDRVVWQESQLPRGVAVMVNNRPCKLTATVVGDQVRIDLEEVKTGLRASTK